MTVCLPVLAILLSFAFFVNSQPLYNSTAIAPILWINSPAIPSTNFSNSNLFARVLLLQLNPDGYGPSFAAGFYGSFLSIFIVNADRAGIVTDSFFPQVIWTADQDRPVSENATLQLTSQSGLTLRDSNGSIIWTTDVGNRSVAGINITEYGNLMLFDKDNSSIWQSWEYPTDSLVIGQSLAGGQTLNAVSSYYTDLKDVPVPYLTLRAGGLFAFVNSDPPQLYGQITLNSNMSVDNSIFMTFANGTLKMSSLLHKPNESQVLINLGAAKGIQYMKLESDGHLGIYEYNSTTDNWNMVRDLFGTEKCNYPASCGRYGICIINNECTCPQDYFTPVDQQQELGCSEITPINCEDVNNIHWSTINDVSYFNYIDNTEFSIADEESCKEACLRNCSCKAVVFYYYGNSYSGRCFALSEVFSFKKYQADSIDPDSPDSYGSAYIKVQVGPSPSPSSPPQHYSSRVGLGLILGSTFGALLLLLALISIYLVCLRRGEEAQDDLIEQLPGMPTRFSFEELRMATENFTKKLGEGGFGTVFEGSWDNERIAVKSLYSIEHGKNDFLAEVETIGNIHHINLVRLIGFCADKLNRLLVYEYMCNGSLDKWIYVVRGEFLWIGQLDLKL